MEQTQQTILRFRMRDYLILFDSIGQEWTWHRWEKLEDKNGITSVIRKRGKIAFKRMFRSLLGDPESKKQLSRIRSRKQMREQLEDQGFDYIFLHQGESFEENRFETIDAVAQYYQLDECPEWGLTAYWFAFDQAIQSWCMYHVESGKPVFTPDQAANRIASQKKEPFCVPVDFAATDAYASVH